MEDRAGIIAGEGEVVRKHRVLDAGGFFPFHQLLCIGAVEQFAHYNVVEVPADRAVDDGVAAYRGA